MILGTVLMLGSLITTKTNHSYPSVIFLHSYSLRVLEAGESKIKVLADSCPGEDPLFLDLHADGCLLTLSLPVGVSSE